LKKIAVLLTTFNGVEFLGEQVYTILNQIDVNITLYVSDDHSSDGTLQYLNDLAGLNSRIVILPKTERVGAAGKNFYRLVCDVDTSGFDYVAFADQDDIWNLDKLSRHVELIKAKNAECVSSNVMAFWPEGSKKLICKSQPQKKYDFIFESAGPGCTFLMTPLLVNKLRQCLLSNQIAKDIALHDWLTYAVCRSLGKKWVIDATPSIMYRQHANNVLGANSGFRALFARMLKMKQGWYRAEVMKICQVCSSISTDKMFPFILDCLKSKRYFSTLRLLPLVKNFRRDPFERLALALMIMFGLF
jgi:rhamnosyltransferase